jgi:membrane protein DedA with SNARE-associated domain
MYMLRRSPGNCQDELWSSLLFPTDLASFLDLIRQHGDAAYSIMLVYAASHSLLLALFAGYAAHSGALHLGTLILVCWFGSFAGDAVRFWIGRRYGTRLLGSFPQLDRAVQTAARLDDRHYVLMILFHQYPHGIRGIAGFAFGMSRLPWSTFLTLNFVAAGLTVVFWVGLALLVLGTGPLLLFIIAAGLGLTSEPNPSPIDPGLLAFFTFWPAVILIVWGLVISVRRYRKQTG